VLIVAKLLPATIEFYRTPITPSVTPPKKISPSLPARAAIYAAVAREKASKTQNTSIYGSVTTRDITANFKAVLEEDDKGALVALSPEDISFVETEEKDRVKNLGQFAIDIKLKGTTDLIRRTVKVSAQH
jgi:ribosomal protein L9